MSRFFSNKYQTLEPYVPGEQPKDQKYIKLNTNESPFPPSPKAISLASEATKKLQLYSDPECRELTTLAAKTPRLIQISEVANCIPLSYWSEGDMFPSPVPKNM